MHLTVHILFADKKGINRMTDMIVIGAVLLVLALGVIWTVKHFGGKSGCCGGGGFRLKKKKLSAVLYQKTFCVGGMHCVNCKTRVEETVNDIKGVAGRVDLKTGKLTVSYATHVEDALIVARLERLGYTVEEIV